ncbi:MFS transporter [Novosphingobium sp. FSY-8]|uniref:MFS transporter n=1 Tax=Novosphingobium ovatum TaxID=1908523 RepID=A0ABW9XB97_9SPHN|nr:MFS transporter [Novosphingobium ovatum]NBC35815.1 MFS transporter [Novosphingobium ovatum]
MSQAHTAEPTAAPETQPTGGFAAWWVAIVLMLANTLAFVDRQALALLVQPIKRDLAISDTAISLLYGLSFTLFYVAVGIPIARLADRTNRRNIIAASVFVWSIATSLCGLARGFASLFAARVMVGAGEGGLTPSAYSLLSDTFPKQRLPLAMGIYQVGIYLGSALALVIGGLISTVIPPSETVLLPVLGALKGGQIVFLLLGLPGLVLALVILTLREPARAGASAGGKVESVPLAQFLGHMRGRWQAYSGIMLGFALMILVGNGTAVWIPAFFERKFGWTTAQVGSLYGPVVFFCGTGGALIGGFVASWLRARWAAHGNLVASLGGLIALVPVTIAFPLMSTASSALALIGLMNFLAGFNYGGGLSSLQELTPNRMRAQVSATYMLVINLIGAALGPTLMALVTDYWFRDPQALPYAISIVSCVASPLAVVMLWLGLRDYRRHQAQG